MAPKVWRPRPSGWTPPIIMKLKKPPWSAAELLSHKITKLLRHTAAERGVRYSKSYWIEMQDVACALETTFECIKDAIEADTADRFEMWRRGGVWMTRASAKQTLPDVGAAIDDAADDAADDADDAATDDEDEDVADEFDEEETPIRQSHRIRNDQKNRQGLPALKNTVWRPRKKAESRRHR